MKVTSLDDGIKLGRIGKIGDTTVYLFRWHPELSFFQNILLNISLIFIEKR